MQESVPGSTLPVFGGAERVAGTAPPNRLQGESLVMSMETLRGLMAVRDGPRELEESEALLRQAVEYLRLRGWLVPVYGSSAREARVRGNLIASFGRILERGDGYAADLASRVRAVARYHRKRDVLGFSAAAAFRPWSLPGETETEGPPPMARAATW